MYLEESGVRQKGHGSDEGCLGGGALVTRDGTTYEVILADDEGEFRGWMRSLLDGSHEFNVVGEAGSGREVLELADHLMPDPRNQRRGHGRQ